MKTIGIKVTVIALALGVAVFALAGAVSATSVSAVITVPDQVTVGQPAEVQARLLTVDDGLPVAGTPLTFFVDASFAGVSGDVELGRAVTDENGVAAITFEPRAASEHEIRVEYMLPGDSEPQVVSRSISVVATGSQLHRSTAGVDIPGLGVWLIIALVSTVWLILLSVALRVVAIARDGRDAVMIPERAAGPTHAAGRLASGSDPRAVR